jgi:PEP-CTERM motif
MIRRRSFLAAIAILAIGALAAPSARAAYLVTFEENNGDVLEVGSGTLDLTDLLTDGHATNSPAVWAAQAFFDSGADKVDLDLYLGAVGPSTFGAGALSHPDASSGDGVGIGGISSGLLGVPAGYSSGNALSETSIYLNSTLASLGMTPGGYVYSWGAGAHADTFTIDIGLITSPPAIPEPSTWAMLLLGFGGVGYIALRRKDAVVLC